MPTQTNSFFQSLDLCLCLHARSSHNIHTESLDQISGAQQASLAHEHACVCWDEKQANGARQLSTSINPETHLAN